jgi:hypothetical protein
MTSEPEAAVVDAPGSEGNPFAHTFVNLDKVKNPNPKANALLRKVLRTIK